MKALRWALLLVLLAVLGGAAFGVHRLLYTTRGLEFALSLLQHIEAAKIEVSGARGTIASELHFNRVVVDHAAVRVVADDVEGRLDLPSLLGGRIAVEGARIGRAEVILKEREPVPESLTHFLPPGLSLTAPGVVVNRVGLVLKGGYRMHVETVRGDLRMTRWRIDVDPFVMDDPAGHIDGKVFLRATLPLGLRGEASGAWRLPDELTYQFAARVNGKLDRLGVDASITQPARLAFSGTALDLTGDARAVGTLRAIEFDGSPWVPPKQLPSLSGSLSVDVRRDGIGLSGTLTAPELGAEQMRVRGSGRYGDGVISIVALRAWMPRSELSLTTEGTITLGGEAPGLDLAGDWSKFRWPLGGEPFVESGTGTYTLAGRMPYAFTVKADARGPYIPAANFTAAGSLDRDQLVLGRFEGTTLDGRLQGSGRLSWRGDEPWRAEVNGRALNLAGLRPDLAGRIDVAGEIEGRGFTPDAPWTARLTQLSGTLYGRALTGSGEVSHAKGSYEFRRVRLANGGSHVDIDGRWGPQVDLRWTADLRSLGLVDPAMKGSLASSGSARGTAVRPEIDASARVRGFSYQGVAADTIDADLDVDLGDRRDSRVDVRASDVAFAAQQFTTVRLKAEGRTSDHDLQITAASRGNPERRFAGFETRIEAAGAADVGRRTWQGTLLEAAFEFPDGGARLVQPAALALGPDRIDVAPLCLATDDARLCAEAEWHRSPESWRVLYSAQDWPLRRLITTLLGRRDFDGKLQLSGWAEQQPGQDWVGGAAVIVDQPTFEVRRNRSRTEVVRIGGGRIDFYADAGELRATADMDMAASTRLRGEVRAPRERGRPLQANPLSGEIRAESSVLTALPLFVPEIDRSEGRLDGSVRVGGTLGDPRFDGEFHLRDGRLDLYRTNLSLTGATLDGRFVGDTLEFAGQASTREGPVTLDGRFRWPEGVMTGSMRLKGENLLVADTPEYRVLASPDLTILADGGQYTVTGEVFIPSARIAPKDLSTSVGTSEDERIVGGEAEVAEPSTMQRVRSEIRVRLGDDVRVDSYGLKARLGGEVLVRTAPGDRARGDGAITVVEGEYKAFGVYVRITRGVLSFRNSPLGEPTLDLVAEREIKDENIRITVNVRGELDNPFVTLSSEPAMPNNEALSYLLTGRSLNTLQSNEAASVNRAAESLAISGGGLLLGSLGTRLGIDEVSVESAGADDTQVVLGKFLSPKLFVSYGISIAEAINTVKLRYTLNPRWSLKAEAGLEQSADVEFRIER
jgi:translocation and assembly module TamB